MKNIYSITLKNNVTKKTLTAIVKDSYQIGITYCFKLISINTLREFTLYYNLSTGYVTTNSPASVPERFSRVVESVCVGNELVNVTYYFDHCVNNFKYIFKLKSKNNYKHLQCSEFFNLIFNSNI